MRYVPIQKEFFKKFKWRLELPTIKCKVCGEDILDTPTNRLKNICNITVDNSQDINK